MIQYNPENFIHLETKTFFDRFIQTNQYQESEYQTLWEMLLENPGFICTHATHSTNRLWFDRYLKVEKLLTERLNRSQPTPLAGDAVLIQCSNGKVYEDAMIAYGPTHERDTFSVVTEGGGHIINIDQSPQQSLKMAVCGGYFMGVHLDEFHPEMKDTIDKPFWFWGDKPCGNGGIWITRPVPRWHLKQINPKFY